MAITFNTNLAALGAQRNIGIASNAASSSLQKLSSGSRVPQAKDDAAGLAIGSKLKSEVAGLTQASNNAAQAISLLQIADGALSTEGDILQRMKALAVQSSSGQLDDASRSLLNQEFSNLQKEVDRIAGVTNFNGNNLLAGSDTVAGNNNDLVGAANLVAGKGITETFDNDFGNGAIQIDYTAASKSLKVTDLVSGVSQTLTVDNATIAAGKTETYDFSNLGVKLNLDSTFSKTTDIKGVNSATVQAGVGISSVASATAATAITGTAGTSTVAMGAITLNGTGANAMQQWQIATPTNITVSGTNTAATFSNVVIGSHTFTAGPVDLSGATGLKTVNYSDGSGNSFTLNVTTTVAYTGAITAGSIRVTEVNTSTGYTNATAVTGTGGTISKSTITATNFAGTGTNAFTAPLAGAIAVGGTVNAATFSLTVAGHTFTSAAATDLTATGGVGNKNITMSDGNGNSFQLNLELATVYTGVAAAGGTITISAGSTGGVVDSTTTLPAVTAIAVSPDVPVKFGDLSNNVVKVTAGAAGATTVTMTIAGVAFSSANTGGSASLTNATGAKTAVLTDGNGNSISLSYNVTTALSNGDTANLTLGQLGQVVGADSTHSELNNFDFKVGTGTTVNDSITFGISSASTKSLGIDTSSIDTAVNANLAINAVNAAITGVASRRADIGASQSRLDFASNSISVSIENTTAAQSALLDVDVSSEITNFTNENVLMQAGISLLGQANQQPALLLRLLQ